MEAMILNFRGGRHTKSNNQMILKVENINDKEKAKALIGKKVVWKSSTGKEIKGTVKALHGNSCALRVLFERGMPGQAIGTKVNVE